MARFGRVECASSAQAARSHCESERSNSGNKKKIIKKKPPHSEDPDRRHPSTCDRLFARQVKEEHELDSRACEQPICPPLYPRRAENSKQKVLNIEQERSIRNKNIYIQKNKIKRALGRTYSPP